MDDGLRARRRSPHDTNPSVGSVSRRSMAHHHRRRRRLATLLVILTAVIVFSGAAWTLTGRASAPGRPLTAVAPRNAFITRVVALGGRGPGSFAAQNAAAELAATDRTLRTTPFLRIAGRQHREVALTFDDGPGPYTPRILTALERARVPATFFAVGVLEQWFHASTAREVRDGDVVGDHTYSHAPMSALSASAQRAQLVEDVDAIERAGAPVPRLFRPPYGSFNATTPSLLRGMRMLMVLWTVDTSDYRRPGVRAIVRSALAGARPGAIILLHDAGGNRAETVAAVPQIIAGLRRRHYTLVTVPRLLLDNPAPARQTLGAMPTGGG